MKFKQIFEIYDVEDKSVERPTTDGLAGGVFASVYPHPDDDHMVVKKSRPLVPYSAYNPDVYPKFVEALVRDEIWKKNPHFPRIYTKADDSWTMEKLIKGVHVEAESLMAWAVSNLSDNAIESILVELVTMEREVVVHYRETGNFGETDPYQNVSIAISIFPVISECIISKKNIKSESLIEAVAWVHKLVEDTHTMLDIHDENFMWRREPHGIQLVITDPIWDGLKHEI